MYRTLIGKGFGVFVSGKVGFIVSDGEGDR